MELSDEELAFNLVKLYVQEVSQRGEKRQMSFDTIINAYFYALYKIKQKKAAMAEGQKVEYSEEGEGEEIEKVRFPGEEREGFEF